MPRTAITVTQVTRLGVAPATATAGYATNDHSIADNDGRVWLEAASTAGSATVITVETPGTVDGLAVADLTVSVPTNATRIIGPFPPAIYNQSDGSLYVGVEQTTWNLRAFRL